MNIKNSIAIKNVAGRPLRSTALILLASFLAFSMFAGILVTSSLKRGFSSLEQRLGADIMVVPYEASTKADLSNIVLQGNTGYFYMNESVYDKIAAREGIGQISAQFFLASTSSSCCSIPVQLIGFDPETDFTITPWIKKSYGEALGFKDVVVGNDLNAFVGDTLSFYGVDVRVAAKLDKTGTSYDTAVFMNRETIEALIQSSLDRNMNDFKNIDPKKVVSCVLIKVADGYVPEEVLNDINIHVKKVKAIQTKNMISGIADSLAGISEVTGVLMAVIWIIGFCILATAFFMMTNERKREFALLRIVGASRKRVSGIVLLEGCIVSLAGSLTGVIIGFLVFLPFGNYIEESLKLPFLLPRTHSLFLWAILSLLTALFAGALSSTFAAGRIGRLEPGTVLREVNG